MIDTAYITISPMNLDGNHAYANPTHRAVTFEVECHRESFTLVIFDAIDKTFINSFIIDKPSFVVVDNTNWARYVDSCIDTLGVSADPKRSTQKTWVLSSGVKFRKCVSIGLINFQLIVPDGINYRVTTLERTANFTSTKVNALYKVFGNRFKEKIDYVYVSVDLEGILIQPVGENRGVVDRDIRDNVYRLSFSNPIDLETIFYASSRTGPLSTYQILKYTKGNDNKDSAHPHHMVWKSIGGFEYLEANDNKFKIVFHEKLEEPIVSLIREALLIAVQKEDTKGLYSTLNHINANNSLDSVFKFIETIKDS